jgi:protein-L-isoaspartate(D-aspartate) O-methyltransferase
MENPYLVSINCFKINRERVLGAGTYGPLFYAGDTMGDHYAVKIIGTEPGVNEIKIEEDLHVLKKLSHPNLMKFEGYDKVRAHDGQFATYYLLFELPGIDLEEFLSQQKQEFNDIDNIRRLIFQMTDVGEYLAHQNHMCHGNIDVKNIVRDKSSKLWKLTNRPPKPIDEIEDVFALGLVFLRVCGVDYLQEVKNSKDVSLMHKVEDAIKDVKTKLKDETIVAILNRMLDFDPITRITFQELKKLLNSSHEFTQLIREDKLLCKWQEERERLEEEIKMLRIGNKEINEKLFQLMDENRDLRETSEAQSDEIAELAGKIDKKEGEMKDLTQENERLRRRPEPNAQDRIRDFRFEFLTLALEEKLRASARLEEKLEAAQAGIKLLKHENEVLAKERDQYKKQMNEALGLQEPEPKPLTKEEAFAQFKPENPENVELVAEVKENVIMTGKKMSPEVEKVMRTTDRADFCSYHPYVDNAQRIGYNATISAPHMHCIALECLKDHLKYAKRALDLGSGTAYSTLAMAKLMESPDAVCYGIDHIKDLCDQSIKNIKKNHEEYITFGKVVIEEGDGRLGLEKYGPYDVIHIGAAANQVPPKCLEQLARGGRIVMPLGERNMQQYTVIDKDSNGVVHANPLFGVAFMQLQSIEEQSRGF